MKDIVIVGASGFAQEIKWLIDRINSATPCWNFLGYIDNCASNSDVIGNDAYLCSYSKELYVVIAIADTALRYRLVTFFSGNQMLKFPNLIDPSTIGHGAIIEDFVTINPSVNISGNARLAKGASVATGSQILQGRCIGINTVIGAGSVILKDISNDCTAVGVPTKIIKDRRE